MNLITFALGMSLGGLVGGGVVAATAHWPLACQVDGSLIWTAIGAIGSAGAAIGAVYAAIIAIRAAKMPLEAQSNGRVDRARIVAEALSEELFRAGENAHRAAEMLRALRKGPRKALIDEASLLTCRRTVMIERLYGEPEIFGRDLGATVTVACAAALNFNRALDEVGRWKHGASHTPATEYEEDSILDLIGMAEATHRECETARRALGILIVVGHSRFYPNDVSVVTDKDGRSEIVMSKPSHRGSGEVE